MDRNLAPWVGAQVIGPLFDIRKEENSPISLTQFAQTENRRIVRIAEIDT